MLTQTGQIKVMDFGIARALANSGSTMTQTSAVIGTAQYLSPEQARGEPVDARSDVYATGCVLYELLCGQPPFVGDSPVSVAYQHVREDARPPSLLNRDVPPAIDSVVLKALAKNPLNRYQSAAEMRADLLRAASGRPVYAEPVLFDPAAGATRPMRPTTAGGRAMPGRPESSRRKVSPWAIAGLSVLAVVAVVTLVVGLLMNQDDTIRVPTLVGQSNSDARDLLTEAGLKPEGQSTTSEDCANPNQVTSQSPGPNAAVAPGSTVTFEFCVQPGEVSVPAVVGLPQATAEGMLADVGLEPLIEPVDSSKPKDQVIDVSPGVQESVPRGSTVTLKVSKGNYKEMPNVVGETEDGARAILRNAGFADVQAIPQPVTDPTKDGKVQSQTPVAKTETDPTFVVTIYVGDYTPPQSSSPPTTTTPASPTGTTTTGTN
jgi:serine/threonine-protein kinase